MPAAGAFTVGSGGDYATWQAAMASVVVPLTGNLTYTQISDTTETAVATLAGGDCGVFTLRLNTNNAPGGDPTAGWKININHTGDTFWLVTNLGAGDTFTIVIEDLFFNAVGGASGTQSAINMNALGNLAGTVNMTVERCMCDGNGSMGCFFEAANGRGVGTRILRNNKIWAINSTSTRAVFDANVGGTNQGTGYTIAGNTVYDGGQYGCEEWQAGILTMVDNAMFNSSVRCIGTTVDISSGGNATSDTTGNSGLRNLVSSTVFDSLSDGNSDFLKIGSYQRVGNTNVAPTAGSAPLVVNFSATVTQIGGDNPLQTDGVATTTLTEDIEGNARPGNDSNYSIGCHEVDLQCQLGA